MHRPSLVLRLVTYCISVQFLASSTVLAVPMTTLPEPTRAGDGAMPAAMTISPQLSRQEIKEVLGSNIPEAFGNVKEIFHGTSDKLIIHVQDSHANYEAQTNYAKILDFLGKGKLKGRNKVIGVEGGVGTVDLGIFTKYSDKDILRDIADHFLKEARLNGSEFYALFSQEKTPLRGLEEKDVYVQNLQHFVVSHRIKEELKEPLDYLQRALHGLQQKVFSGDLKALVDISGKNEAGDVKFTEYCDFMGKLATTLSVNTKPYQNFQRVLNVMTLENKIDGKKVDGERSRLIQVLQKKMVKEDMADMVRQSLFFRTGRISANEFYTYLKKLAQKKQVKLTLYRNLHSYIEMVNIHSKLDTNKLFFECDQINDQLRKALFQTEEEKILSDTLKQVATLQRLMGLQMTRDDLNYFQDNKAEIQIAEHILPFVKKTLGKHAIQVAEGIWQLQLESGPLRVEKTRLEAVAALDERLQPMEDFYEVALKRDDVLVNTMLKHMEDLKTSVAIMPTGGFHTSGLTQRLKAKNISYMVITPRITQEANEEIYLARMLNKKMPFERFLQRIGSRLANPDWLSEIGKIRFAANGENKVYDGQENIDAMEDQTRYLYTALVADFYRKIAESRGLEKADAVVGRMMVELSKVGAGVIETRIDQETGAFYVTFKHGTKIQTVVMAVVGEGEPIATPQNLREWEAQVALGNVKVFYGQTIADAIDQEPTRLSVAEPTAPAEEASVETSATKKKTKAAAAAAMPMTVQGDHGEQLGELFEEKWEAGWESKQMKTRAMVAGMSAAGRARKRDTPLAERERMDQGEYDQLVAGLAASRELSTHERPALEGWLSSGAIDSSLARALQLLKNRNGTMHVAKGENYANYEFEGGRNARLNPRFPQAEFVITDGLFLAAYLGQKPDGTRLSDKKKAQAEQLLAAVIIHEVVEHKIYNDLLAGPLKQLFQENEYLARGLARGFANRIAYKSEPRVAPGSDMPLREAIGIQFDAQMGTKESITNLINLVRNTEAAVGEPEDWLVDAESQTNLPIRDAIDQFLRGMSRYTGGLEEFRAKDRAQAETIKSAAVNALTKVKEARDRAKAPPVVARTDAPAARAEAKDEIDTLLQDESLETSAKIRKMRKDIIPNIKGFLEPDKLQKANRALKDLVELARTEAAERPVSAEATAPSADDGLMEEARKIARAIDESITDGANTDYAIEALEKLGRLVTKNQSNKTLYNLMLERANAVLNKLRTEFYDEYARKGQGNYYIDSALAIYEKIQYIESKMGYTSVKGGAGPTSIDLADAVRELKIDKEINRIEAEAIGNQHGFFYQVDDIYIRANNSIRIINSIKKILQTKGITHQQRIKLVNLIAAINGVNGIVSHALAHNSLHGRSGAFTANAAIGEHNDIASAYNGLLRFARSLPAFRPIFEAAEGKKETEAKSAAPAKVTSKLRDAGELSSSDRAKLNRAVSAFEAHIRDQSLVIDGKSYSINDLLEGRQVNFVYDANIKTVGAKIESEGVITITLNEDVAAMLLKGGNDSKMFILLVLNTMRHELDHAATDANASIGEKTDWLTEEFYTTKRDFGYLVQQMIRMNVSPQAFFSFAEANGVEYGETYQKVAAVLYKAMGTGISAERLRLHPIWMKSKDELWTLSMSRVGEELSESETADLVATLKARGGEDRNRGLEIEAARKRAKTPVGAIRVVATRAEAYGYALFQVEKVREDYLRIAEEVSPAEALDRHQEGYQRAQSEAVEAWLALNSEDIEAALDAMARYAKEDKREKYRASTEARFGKMIGTGKVNYKAVLNLYDRLIERVSRAERAGDDEARLAILNVTLSLRAMFESVADGRIWDKDQLLNRDADELENEGVYVEGVEGSDDGGTIITAVIASGFQPRDTGDPNIRSPGLTIAPAVVVKVASTSTTESVTQVAEASQAEETGAKATTAPMRWLQESDARDFFEKWDLDVQRKAQILTVAYHFLQSHPELSGAGQVKLWSVLIANVLSNIGSKNPKVAGVARQVLEDVLSVNPYVEVQRDSWLNQFRVSAYLIARKEGLKIRLGEIGKKRVQEVGESIAAYLTILKKMVASEKISEEQFNKLKDVLLATLRSRLNTAEPALGRDPRPQWKSLLEETKIALAALSAPAKVAVPAKLELRLNTEQTTKVLSFLTAASGGVAFAGIRDDELGLRSEQLEALLRILKIGDDIGLKLEAAGFTASQIDNIYVLVHMALANHSDDLFQAGGARSAEARRRGVKAGIFWVDFDDELFENPEDELFLVDQVVGHSPERESGAEVRWSPNARVVNVDVGHYEGYGANNGALVMEDGVVKAVTYDREGNNPQEKVVKPIPNSQIAPEKLVAVGDIHGDLDAFRSTLRGAGLVDEEGNWIGGQTELVQVGDAIDRGPKSVEVWDYLDKIQEQAAKAGGKVVRLLGNHELLLLNGDWRYANFRGRLALAGRMLKDIEAGRVVGAYETGGILFAHAGIPRHLYDTEEAKSTGETPTQLAERLNRQVRGALIPLEAEPILLAREALGEARAPVLEAPVKVAAKPAVVPVELQRAGATHDRDYENPVQLMLAVDADAPMLQVLHYDDIAADHPLKGTLNPEMEFFILGVGGEYKALRDGESVVLGRAGVFAEDRPASSRNFRSLLQGSVSRKHVRVARQGRKVIVTNLSVNGVTINPATEAVSFRAAASKDAGITFPAKEAETIADRKAKTRVQSLSGVDSEMRELLSLVTGKQVGLTLDIVEPANDAERGQTKFYASNGAKADLLLERDDKTGKITGILITRAAYEQGVLRGSGSALRKRLMIALRHEMQEKMVTRWLRDLIPLLFKEELAAFRSANERAKFVAGLLDELTQAAHNIAFLLEPQGAHGFSQRLDDDLDNGTNGYRASMVAGTGPFLLGIEGDDKARGGNRFLRRLQQLAPGSVIRSQPAFRSLESLLRRRSGLEADGLISAIRKQTQAVAKRALVLNSSPLAPVKVAADIIELSVGEEDTATAAKTAAAKLGGATFPAKDVEEIITAAKDIPLSSNLFKDLSQELRKALEANGIETIGLVDTEEERFVSVDGKSHADLMLRKNGKKITGIVMTKGALQALRYGLGNAETIATRMLVAFRHEITEKKVTDLLQKAYPNAPPDAITKFAQNIAFFLEEQGPYGFSKRQNIRMEESDADDFNLALISGTDAFLKEFQSNLIVQDLLGGTLPEGVAEALDEILAQAKDHKGNARGLATGKLLAAIEAQTYAIRERAIELRRVQEAARIAQTVRDALRGDNKQEALNGLNRMAGLDYEQASALFEEILPELTPVEIEEFLGAGMRASLDPYRYKQKGEDEETAVARIKGKIQDVLSTGRLGEDPSIAHDAGVLVEEVYQLLKDLKIEYHNIQHTLEVTLGTARTVARLYNRGALKDPKSVLLGVVAALKHDIGYSNSERIMQYIRDELTEEEYKEFFTNAKGDVFVKDFERIVAKIKRGEKLNGGEMQQYHVYFGQITMKFVLRGKKAELTNGSFLLAERNIEAMQAMISLTDIKPDHNNYRAGRREFLANQEGFEGLASGELLALGEALETNDLLTQIATADYFEKGLALFYEMVIGEDAGDFGNGLQLLSKTTGFYKYFAKARINPAVQAMLDEQLSEDGEDPEFYRGALNRSLFLYASFGPRYAKLANGEEITEKDITVLRGLQANGLPGEVITLFEAAERVRAGEMMTESQRRQLLRLILQADSPENVTLGDVVRVVLLQDAALRGNVLQMTMLLDGFRDRRVLVEHATGVLHAMQMLKNEFPQRTLAVLDALTKAIGDLAMPPALSLALGTLSEDLPRQEELVRPGTITQYGSIVDTAYPEDRRPTPESIEDATHLDPKLGLMLVADGMGGHAGGAVASRLTVEAVKETVTARALGEATSKEQVKDLLVAALELAGNKMKQAVEENSELKGLGTTASLAVIWQDAEGKRWLVAVNVGDSALFLRRADGQARKITRDDSPVQELLEKRSITREEADVHTEKNRIYAAVMEGGIFYQESASVREIVPIYEELGQGDRLLGFSDGVTDNLGEEKILEMIEKGDSVRTIARYAKRVAQETEEGPHAAPKPDDISGAEMAIPETKIETMVIDRGLVKIVMDALREQYKIAPGERIEFPSGGMIRVRVPLITITENDVEELYAALLADGIGVDQAILVQWAGNYAEAKRFKANFATSTAALEATVAALKRILVKDIADAIGVEDRPGLGQRLEKSDIEIVHAYARSLAGGSSMPTSGDRDGVDRIATVIDKDLRGTRLAWLSENIRSDDPAIREQAGRLLLSALSWAQSQRISVGEQATQEAHEVELAMAANKGAGKRDIDLSPEEKNGVRDEGRESQLNAEEIVALKKALLQTLKDVHPKDMKLTDFDFFEDGKTVMFSVNGKRMAVVFRPVQRASIKGGNLVILTPLQAGERFDDVPVVEIAIAKDLLTNKALTAHMKHELSEGVFQRTHAEAVIVAGFDALQDDVDRAFLELRTALAEGDEAAKKSALDLIRAYAREWKIDSESRQKYKDAIKTRLLKTMDAQSADRQAEIEMSRIDRARALLSLRVQIYTIETFLTTMQDQIIEGENLREFLRLQVQGMLRLAKTMRGDEDAAVDKIVRDIKGLAKEMIRVKMIRVQRSAEERIAQRAGEQTEEQAEEQPTVDYPSLRGIKGGLEDEAKEAAKEEAAETAEEKPVYDVEGKIAALADELAALREAAKQTDREMDKERWVQNMGSRRTVLRQIASLLVIDRVGDRAKARDILINANLWNITGEKPKDNILIAAVEKLPEPTVEEVASEETPDPRGQLILASSRFTRRARSIAIMLFLFLAKPAVAYAQGALLGTNIQFAASLTYWSTFMPMMTYAMLPHMLWAVPLLHLVYRGSKARAEEAKAEKAAEARVQVQKNLRRILDDKLQEFQMLIKPYDQMPQDEGLRRLRLQQPLINAVRQFQGEVNETNTKMLLTALTQALEVQLAGDEVKALDVLLESFSRYVQEFPWFEGTRANFRSAMGRVAQAKIQSEKMEEGLEEGVEKQEYSMFMHDDRSFENYEAFVVYLKEVIRDSTNPQEMARGLIARHNWRLEHGLNKSRSTPLFEREVDIAVVKFGRTLLSYADKISQEQSKPHAAVGQLLAKEAFGRAAATMNNVSDFESRVTTQAPLEEASISDFLKGLLGKDATVIGRRLIANLFPEEGYGSDVLDNYEDKIRQLFEKNPNLYLEKLVRIHNGYDARTALIAQAGVVGVGQSPQLKAHILDLYEADAALREIALALSANEGEIKTRESRYRQLQTELEQNHEAGLDFDSLFSFEGDDFDTLTIKSDDKLPKDIDVLLAEPVLLGSHRFAKLTDTQRKKALNEVKKLRERRGILKKEEYKNIEDQIFDLKQPVGLDVSSKKRFIENYYRALRVFAKAKGKEKISVRQIFVVTTAENFAAVYQYAQLLGDYVVTVLDSEGKLQLSSVLAEVLDEEEMKELGFNANGIDLLPKSRISIMDDVISHKSSAIKA